MNPYQQLDDDLRKVEAFAKKLNNPGLGLGALFQEYVEEVEPAYRRATTTLDQWRTKTVDGPGRPGPDLSPDDDLPF